MIDDPFKKPIPDSYWVEPGRLLAGEYPSRSDSLAARKRLEAFLDAGLNTFVDLTHAGELHPYEPVLRELAEARGIPLEYTRLPIQDHSVPTPAEMRVILDTIEKALAGGRNVYVHCWGGVGRTGTTVGCYLIRGGISSEEALKRLAGWWSRVPKRAYFPQSPETSEQWEFVRRWSE